MYYTLPCMNNLDASSCEMFSYNQRCLIRETPEYARNYEKFDFVV